MCGINGIVFPAGSVRSDGEALIERMNAAIAHRGPDDSGVWSDRRRGVYLGHRRLSIIDLSERGHQPMVAPTGQVIVYNGEVYNFDHLRKHLPDQRYASGTDTEVVLHMCGRYGIDALSHMNGMFAFSFWDPDAGKLTLARDRVGIKPLYYTTADGIFAFSSEIKALLTLPWVGAELDERALYDFLTFNKVAAPASVFRNIHKVPPAHYVVVENAEVVAHEQYWDVAYSNLDDESDAEICDRLAVELDASVTRRMVSDVPVGSFLSGGVDSTAITSLLAEKATGPVNTFSIGFENAATYDERRYAADVASMLGTNHHEKIVSADEFLAFLPKVVEIYDEPLADSTSIPLYFLAQEARRTGTPVVFTGDGADELFCGYRNWRKYAALYPYYTAAQNLPRPVRKALADLTKTFLDGHALHEIFDRAAKGEEFFWGGAGGLKESAKQSFLSDSFKERMKGYSSHSVIERFRTDFEALPKAADRDVDDIDWMCFIGLKFIIPETYMYRADHIAMAHGVEARVPFLDHNLVNLALSIPGNRKIKGGHPKYILKKMLERRIPKEVLYRKKMGFNVPLALWAREFMVGYLEDNLAEFCANTGMFSKAEIRRTIDRTKTGDTRYTFGLWNCFFLMNWFKHWFRV